MKEINAGGEEILRPRFLTETKLQMKIQFKHRYDHKLQARASPVSVEPLV
jgi:hypothetical protein